MVPSAESPGDLLEEADYILDSVDAVVFFLEQTADALDRLSTVEKP